MADYKELLRRAVEALPENNGAARRAVYEKARAALVGQLRAINPPLAARDITAHRLQLEDCIRQVEQEASEAVIAGLGSRDDNVPPPPVYFEQPKSPVAPPVAGRPVARAPAAATAKATPPRETRRPLPSGGSIEEIIAAANASADEAPEPAPRSSAARSDAKPMGKPVPKLVPTNRSRQQPPAPEPEAIDTPEDQEDQVEAVEEVVTAPQFTPRPAGGRPLPSIVARAEAAKNRNSTAAFGASPFEGPRRGPMIEPRREQGPRLQPAARVAQPGAARTATASIALFADEPVPAAMSAVREVDLDPELDGAVDPQGAIDRAIATLDREAQADPDERDAVKHSFHAVNDDDEDLVDDETYESADEDDDDADTNDLTAGAPLLGGFTDPRRGKVGKPAKAEKPARAPKPAKLAKAEKPAKGMFKGAKSRQDDDVAAAFPAARPERSRGGMGAVTVFLIVFAVLLVGAGGAGFWAWREGYVDLDALFGRSTAPVTQSASAVPDNAPEGTADAPATGPGNTDTPPVRDVTAPELKQTERLSPEPAVEQDTAATTEPLALVDPGKTEERLGAAEDTEAATAEQAVASLDPATAAGSQSLLLERADTGVTVPFSGTVDWSKGTDERGLPTLVGKASIPARNLGVDVLIRKNSDPSLPASHLMEVNFKVSDAFIGGSIAGLPGVLLKNEELVQGVPLVGASARVVGNSFLFALSASPDDIAANTALLADRKWMDLALIYATGKRAIITLEKDETAETMFKEVVAAWNAQASN